MFISVLCLTVSSPDYKYQGKDWKGKKGREGLEAPPLQLAGGKSEQLQNP
jgi:hypothetical protein